MILDSKYFIYLSELLDTTVINGQTNRTIGRIIDVIITPREIYPEITAFVVSAGLLRRKLTIPCEDLEPFGLPITRLYLKPNRPLNPFTQLAPNNFLLKDTFLDKQVLDTSGCKVVRVNDLHLLKENNKIWVVHMDIGFRGIARRLGWLNWFDPLVGWVFSYRFPDRFVSWKFVQTIPSNGERLSDKLTLRPAYQCLGELNPADLAEILTDLDRNERMATFKLLDPRTAAEALAELVPKVQKELMDMIDPEKRIEIISRMSSDKAADIVSRLAKRKQEEILKQIPRPKSDEIKALLVHPEETAGALMTTDYLALDKDTTVEQAMLKVKELAASARQVYFYYVYVIDNEQTLLGLVTIRRLLAAQPTAKLAEIMNTKITKIKTGTQHKKIVDTYIKYNFVALPVVDTHNKLKGIILLKDALDKVLAPLITQI